MSENVQLLKEINDQRIEKHALKQQIKQNQLKINQLSMGVDGMYGGDIEQELKGQDMEIDDLTQQIQQYEEQNNILRQSRAHIGQMPPMDGDDQMYQDQYDPNQMAQEQMQMQADMDGMMPEEQMQQPEMVDMEGMDPGMGEEPPAQEQPQPVESSPEPAPVEE